VDDIISKLLKQTLDFTLLNNPVRSSSGFLLGIVISSFYPSLSPLVEKLILIDFSSVPPIGWIALCILIFNIRLPNGKGKISPKAEEAFALIEEARRRGISDEEIKQRYRLLLQEYTSNVALNQQMAAEIEALKGEQRASGSN
jgi:hypothetical protein